MQRVAVRILEGWCRRPSSSFRGGSLEAMTAVDKTAASDSSVDESVFGDIPAKIAQAVKEAVAEHRREGRLIPVDRGNGVELIP